MAITVTQYKNYQNTTLDDYLEWQLETVIPYEILVNTGLSFVYTTVDSNNTDFPYLEYEGHNHQTVMIGGWQRIDEVRIRTGAYTSEPLVLNQDYEPRKQVNLQVPNPSVASPFVKINLLPNNYYNSYYNYYNQNEGLYRFTNDSSSKLYKGSYLRITGIHGYSNGYPADLNNLLYEVTDRRVKENAIRIKTQGNGYLTQEKSRSLQAMYKKADDISELDRGLAISVINDPQVMSLLNKYGSLNRNTTLA